MQPCQHRASRLQAVLPEHMPDVIAAMQETDPVTTTSLLAELGYSPCNPCEGGNLCGGSAGGGKAGQEDVGSGSCDSEQQAVLIPPPLQWASADSSAEAAVGGGKASVGVGGAPAVRTEVLSGGGGGASALSGGGAVVGGSAAAAPFAFSMYTCPDVLRALAAAAEAAAAQGTVAHISDAPPPTPALPCAPPLTLSLPLCATPPLPLPLPLSLTLSASAPPLPPLPSFPCGPPPCAAPHPLDMILDPSPSCLPFAAIPSTTTPLIPAAITGATALPIPTLSAPCGITSAPSSLPTLWPLCMGPEAPIALTSCPAPAPAAGQAPALCFGRHLPLSGGVIAAEPTLSSSTAPASELVWGALSAFMACTAPGKGAATACPSNHSGCTAPTAPTAPTRTALTAPTASTALLEPNPGAALQGGNAPTLPPTLSALPPPLSALPLTPSALPPPLPALQAPFPAVNVQQTSGNGLAFAEGSSASVAPPVPSSLTLTTSPAQLGEGEQLIDSCTHPTPAALSAALLQLPPQLAPQLPALQLMLNSTTAQPSAAPQRTWGPGGVEACAIVLPAGLSPQPQSLPSLLLQPLPPLQPHISPDLNLPQAFPSLDLPLGLHGLGTDWLGGLGLQGLGHGAGLLGSLGHLGGWGLQGVRGDQGRSTLGEQGIGTLGELQGLNVMPGEGLQGLGMMPGELGLPSGGMQGLEGLQGLGMMWPPGGGSGVLGLPMGGRQGLGAQGGFEELDLSALGLLPGLLLPQLPHLAAPSAAPPAAGVRKRSRSSSLQPDGGMSPAHGATQVRTGIAVSEGQTGVTLAGVGQGW